MIKKQYLILLVQNMLRVIQLEYMEKSPNISILLNIFEEHLDHYESFELLYGEE